MYIYIYIFFFNIYQLVVFNLQLVSNNIATWLLTTVPGSLEQYRPPPRFVPFPTLRLWHITLLPCRPCLDCLAHVLCTFWTPNPIVSAPQHSSTHHPTHVREAWTSTTPTHASFYLRTDLERPTMMLAMRPCAQRNIACRRHCAHFGRPRPYLSHTAPFTSKRPSAKLDQHYPHPCFVLLAHCPRAACTDACGATMCSTQPCLPRAFCTFWTPKTIPQPPNTAPFTSPRASAKHGAALPPPMLRSTFALPQSSLQ